MLTLFLLAVLSVASAEVYYKNEFNTGNLDAWTNSKTRDDIGQFTLSPGEWFGDEKKDTGMFTSEDMKFYGISTKAENSITTRGKDLVIQFSVKHEKREYSFCGGGYIKLMPKDTDLEKFGGDTPYAIMFGPDMCGYDVSRIHAILNYKGENLLKTEDIKLDYADKNEFTHLYTLVLKADKTYTVYFDQVVKSEGKLVDDWAFPKLEIDDPEDFIPAEWVHAVEIPDSEDIKPEGYDDIPVEIPDPEAAKPEDWDDEDDGDWEPPMIENPEFKGEWKQKTVKNPEYIGEWSPAMMANPDYTDDIANYDELGALGFELWVVNGGSVIDNIFIGDNYEEAKEFADQTWVVTAADEKEPQKAFEAIKKAKKDAEQAEEDAKKAAEDAEKATEDEDAEKEVESDEEGAEAAKNEDSHNEL